MSAYPNANNGFLPLSPFTSSNVTSEERSSAIDFVNRVNYLFEEFDTDKMSTAFLPDASVHHAYGVNQGKEELTRFITKDYPPLIPGVSRHATNHIVDRDEETGGVVVRYNNLLLRHVWPTEADKVTADEATMVMGLPGIWMWSTMSDRLKMTTEGWKISSRVIGALVVNKSLGPDGKPGA
ncbi:hypothetical protein F5X68DRAFT_227426 [Plectosphaerella plurivora]|uniref:SnoaL-like domain-containing protein n=1 Tax=Plectosphaerella plurivora TaxID=936078 RepID=A0A9P9AFN2_9PEZI|nr:hypothetical protein F5X68DRAFT_227426 [Plectosphaerella plurivora]